MCNLKFTISGSERQASVESSNCFVCDINVCPFCFDETNGTKKRPHYGAQNVGRYSCKKELKTYVKTSPKD